MNADKINFLIQTNELWPCIKELSKTSFSNELFDKGYLMHYTNIISREESFVDILIEACETNALKHIGCLYDDLVFNKILVPNSIAIKDLIYKTKTNYLRLDGRPRGSKKSITNVNNFSFGKIENKKYFFSSVLGIYSIELLKAFKSLGINNAWQIETTCPFYVNKHFPELKLLENCYAPTKRLCRYDNIIVKGKVDSFYLIKYGLSMNYISSLLKYSKKSISNILNDII